MLQRIVDTMILAGASVLYSVAVFFLKLRRL